MDKLKAVKNNLTPQDLTLFDEFEKNVNAIVEILEGGTRTIDKWLEYLGKIKEHNLRFLPKKTADDVISICESFYPFADLFPEIQRFLITHVPQFEDRVEKRYSDINEKIQEIVCKCGQDPRNPPPNPAIPYGEMTELRRYIEKLLGDLRFCVQVAREEHAEKTDLTSTDRKGGRISNFLWMLYEKTLKAFFDSLFGKWGPK